MFNVASRFSARHVSVYPQLPKEAAAPAPTLSALQASTAAANLGTLLLQTKLCDKPSTDLQAWIAAAHEANADEKERFKLRSEGKAPPNKNGYIPIIYNIA